MKNNITKFITRFISLFLGIVLFFYLLFHISYMHRGYKILTGFYSQEKNTMDVIFIGTSTTYTSFVPLDAWKEYGISSYIYSTNVMFENFIKYSIRDIFRYQSPKLLLIDITPYLFKTYAGSNYFTDDKLDVYIKYNIDSRKYSFDRLEYLNEIIKDKNGTISDYIYYFFDIARYHTNDIDISNYNNSKKDPNYGFKHMRLVDGVDIDIENAIQDEGQSKAISSREISYLNELIDYVKDLNIDILFYCPPIYTYEKLNIESKNFVKQHIESSGLPFLDLYNKKEEIGLDYRYDYYDYMHFNLLGAEKITNYLCDYIINNYKIEDRRGNIKYNFLNEDYKEWEKIKEEYDFLDRTGVEALKLNMPRH